MKQMMIYNTLSRKKEPFVPVHEGKCVIYACGPMVMLKGVAKLAEQYGVECQVSLEQRMACGIGACLSCVCKSTQEDAHSRVHNKRVCAEGPVFAAEEVEL